MSMWNQSWTWLRMRLGPQARTSERDQAFANCALRQTGDIVQLEFAQDVAPANLD